MLYACFSASLLLLRGVPAAPLVPEPPFSVSKDTPKYLLRCRSQQVSVHRYRATRSIGIAPHVNLSRSRVSDCDDV
jgi:hypothetical protein